MEVSGYQLREAAKVWMLRLTTVESQFEGSLIKFPGENKPAPIDLSVEIMRCEQAVALLNTAQAHFNLNTRVTVDGKSITLAQAIKLIGGAGRMEKMWRSAATGERTDRYNRNNTRDKDSVVAIRTITFNEALEQAKKAAIYAGQLRSAIAEGNANKLDVPFLNSELING